MNYSGGPIKSQGALKVEGGGRKIRVRERDVMTEPSWSDTV